MIIFFGPVASGKSMQGQLLSADNGWRWVSAGQMLRDTKDPVILKVMQNGELVADELVNNLVSEAIANSKDAKRIILDGYPRTLSEAKWLLDNEPSHGRAIQLVIVMEVPEDEIIKRLKVRGRADDQPDVALRRIELYREETGPILDLMGKNGIKIIRINGQGSISDVHSKVEAAVKQCLHE